MHSNSFQSTQGLQLLLTLWLDKVFDERKNVLEQFNKLKFYIANFKPLAEIDEGDRDKMLTFLHQASECHLDLEEFKVQVFYSIYITTIRILVII